MTERLSFMVGNERNGQLVQISNSPETSNNWKAFQLAVGTVVKLVSQRNNKRKRITIRNTHATETVYIGSDLDISATTGFRLKSDDTYVLHTHGSVYVVAAGTSSIDIIEEFDD